MNFEGKVIVQSTIAIIYQPVLNIKKLAFDFEEKLKGRFQPPQVLPIPDEAPPEIPRLVFRSTHGHSALTMTLVKAELVTNYDDNFNGDLDKCLQYVLEKTALLSEITDLGKIEPIGVALSFNMRWKARGISQDECVSVLQNKYLPMILKDGELEDFRVNKTDRLDDNLFVSTNFSNYRIYHSKTPITSPYISLSHLELKEYGLELALEVNDRYGFNKGMPFRGISQLKEFTTHMKAEISKHEKSIVAGGEQP